MLSACLLAVALCAAVIAGPAEAQDANTLRARHAALREQLASNQFGRPLHVESSENSGEQVGEIYTTIEQPYSMVGPALQAMHHWCDIVILQVNVKHCEASSAGAADTLTVFIARKADDPLDKAYRVDFRYEVAAASADYLHVALRSPAGPLGTTNYRIRLEAAPLDARRTFVHISYSYALGMVARIAMHGYLVTSGRGKVGFSVVERLPDGRPVYVGGLRGVVERNAMRYYLSVEAYLGALGAFPPERQEKRLRDWWAAIERYPAQLHERLGRDEYLEMKRTELRRQQTRLAE